MITVYILTNEGLSNVTELRRRFTHNLFNVELCKPSRKPYEERVAECARRCPSEYCIILSDKMICNQSSKYLRKVVTEMMNIDGLDIGYLFKYNDKCQMHTGESNNVVRTYSPHGIEGLFLTKSGMKIVSGEKKLKNGKKIKCKDLDSQLNKLINKGHILAVAVTPNVFEFDIAKYATDPKQYEYRNECAPLQDFREEITDNSRTIMVLLFILLLIIVFVWAMLSINE